MSGKLRNKIFRGMFCTLLFYIVVSVSITTLLLYKNAEKNAEQNNKTIAVYMKQYLEQFGEEQIETLEVPNDERVTLISKDGNVLYDSKINHEVMENHKGREEFLQALESGSGSARRISDTLEREYYYYAILLKTGNVLRIAVCYDSIYTTVKNIVPPMIGIGFGIILFSLWISDYQTRRIVAPINQINIKRPEESEVYDELAPFVWRIRRQNKVIEKQMEDLKARQIEFTAITENMQEGLIILGESGKVLSYNKSAMRLLDVQSYGIPYDNVIMLNRNTELTKMVQQALGGQRAEQKITIKSRICHLITNPVMDQGKCSGVVVLIMDITEQELNETMRREFSANVSHELKTPLTAISGYAEIIKSGIARSEDIQKFADIIYTESARMIQLVGDIIRISKLDEGKIQIEKSEFQLSDLFKEIIQRVSFAAEKKQVEIIFEDTSLNSQIFAVKQVVDDMLYNVVENAVKYNKLGGKVQISLQSEEGKLTAAVKDTGIGIPEKDMDRIFERFYRVDKSHSREIGGTGLGLSIVKHGAAFTGAKVEVKSVEGEGSCFTFAFPLK